MLLVRRGYTDPRIKTDRISEQSGSTHVQPNHCISNVDMITKTDPRVSASTWRKTPANVSLTRRSTAKAMLVWWHLFRHRTFIKARLWFNPPFRTSYLPCWHFPNGSVHAKPRHESDRDLHHRERSTFRTDSPAIPTQPQTEETILFNATKNGDVQRNSGIRILGTHEKSVGVDIRRVEQPLKCFNQNKQGYHTQKKCIDEPGEDL